MDDSTNVLSSVWENGKVIYLKKSTSFGELFEKTVGNDQILLNVEVEYSVSDGKSTNPDGPLIYHLKKFCQEDS
jgi:hypothetical protein